MKVWLLRPVGYEDENQAHFFGDELPKDWQPWYDKAFGFVVRAETASRAREMAAENCGDEKPDPWRDPSKSTCEELATDGHASVILRDFNAA